MLQRMLRRNFAFVLAALGILLNIVLIAAPATAQTRVSDKDLEALIHNLRDDSKSFEPVFNKAIDRSIIRKTSRDKDSKELAARFTKETDWLLNSFKKTKKGDQELDDLFATGEQIDKEVQELNLGPETTTRWQKISAELDQLAAAFEISIPTHRYPAPPPPAGP